MSRPTKHYFMLFLAGMFSVFIISLLFSVNVAPVSAAPSCSSPTVITGTGSWSVTTSGTCFKYVNTGYTHGGLFSVSKDSSSTTDTLNWYGWTDQTGTSCVNETDNTHVTGNGGQLNNFAIAFDSTGAMYLSITGSATNTITISSIQNWSNGSGCSVLPTPISGGATNTPTKTNTPSGPTATPTKTNTPTNTPAVPTNTPSGSGCTNTGHYSVHGNNICDPSGNVFRFHGMDHSGLEVNCTDTDSGHTMSQTDFNTIASWHANAVRIALNQDSWLGSNSCGASTYQANVLSDYNMAKTAGIAAVIFDLHWNQGGQQLMADSNSLTFWTQFANAYKSHGDVVFEAYNEPENLTAACWLNGGSSCPLVGPNNVQMVGMQTIINTIRNTGATNLILVGGVNWAYQFDKDSNGVALTLPTGTDIAYTTHPYWNFAGKGPTDTGSGDWDTHFGYLLSSVPIVATEFGNSATCDQTGYQTFMTYVQNHPNLSFTSWAWNSPGNCTFPSDIANWQGTPSSDGIPVATQMKSMP